MMDEKAWELHGFAVRLLDYIQLCNEKRLVPVKHDLNLFRNELYRIERKDR